MAHERLASILKRHFFVIVIYFMAFAYLSNLHPQPIAHVACKSNISSSNRFEPVTNTISPTRTLVIYVYANNHPSAEENLAFFIRTAVRSSHDADYYFIIQQINDAVLDEKKLPLLPSNAHYVQHENRCFDLGTVGWFLSSSTIDKTKYKYFIFLNASVRGPFIVAYYDSPIWYTIFTRRLNEHIKLLGCTISCQGGPHVQSYLWAFSLKTLNFLLKNSGVFGCHPTMWITILKGEIDASTVLLNAGYEIDSLMTKYRGADFRYNATEKCGNSSTFSNPAFNKGVDNITLDPYEVVFVKTKSDADYYEENSERVRLYEKWLHG